MFFWLVILGAWMGWVETVYGKHPDSGAHPALESVSEKQPPCASAWYAPLPEPPLYLSNKVSEPDDTPEVADKYQRDVARSRR